MPVAKTKTVEFAVSKALLDKLGAEKLVVTHGTLTKGIVTDLEVLKKLTAKDLETHGLQVMLVPKEQ